VMPEYFDPDQVPGATPGGPRFNPDPADGLPQVGIYRGKLVRREDWTPEIYEAATRWHVWVALLNHLAAEAVEGEVLHAIFRKVMTQTDECPRHLGRSGYQPPRPFELPPWRRRTTPMMTNERPYCQVAGCHHRAVRCVELDLPMCWEATREYTTVTVVV